MRRGATRSDIRPTRSPDIESLSHKGTKFTPTERPSKWTYSTGSVSGKLLHRRSDITNLLLGEERE